MEELENGLLTSHAYSVTMIRYVSLDSSFLGKFKSSFVPNGKLQMIRLRNPWGMGEWRGAYSDGWAAFLMIAVFCFHVEILYAWWTPLNVVISVQDELATIWVAFFDSYPVDSWNLWPRFINLWPYNLRNLWPIVETICDYCIMT